MINVFDIVKPLLDWTGVPDAIGRRRQRAALMGAFAIELHELRFLLALVLLQVHSKLRTLEQGALDLMRPLFLGYKESDGDDAALLAATKQLLARGDPEFIALHNAPRADTGKALRPVPYEVPVLTAHLGDLALFPPTTQQHLGRVASELRLFNEQVAFVQQAHDRTFDTSLSPANYAANNQNLREGTVKLAVRTAATIKAINRILGPEGNPLK